MEFKFPVNEIFKEPIVQVTPSLVPNGFAGDRRALWDAIAKVSKVVDAMGEASARAQGLTKPITTSDRLRNSEQNIYFLVDQQAGNGRGAVTGMLKTGKKGLYVFDREGEHYKVTPPCVLDFYIHEAYQRHGLGKRLFEHMLQQEQIHPVKLAIDRPSEKFLNFLNKHYGLCNPIKQMNNFVVYDGFFPSGSGECEENSNTKSPKVSANGLQLTPTPLGRYGAPRPPCSMGQIIHNQTSTLPSSTEPSGTQSTPVANYQYGSSPLNPNLTGNQNNMIAWYQQNNIPTQNTPPMAQNTISSYNMQQGQYPATPRTNYPALTYEQNQNNINKMYHQSPNQSYTQPISNALQYDNQIQPVPPSQPVINQQSSQLIPTITSQTNYLQQVAQQPQQPIAAYHAQTTYNQIPQQQLQQSPQQQQQQIGIKQQYSQPQLGMQQQQYDIQAQQEYLKQQQAHLQDQQQINEQQLQQNLLLQQQDLQKQQQQQQQQVMLQQQIQQQAAQQQREQYEQQQGLLQRQQIEQDKLYMQQQQQEQLKLQQEQQQQQDLNMQQEQIRLQYQQQEQLRLQQQQQEQLRLQQQQQEQLRLQQQQQEQLRLQKQQEQLLFQQQQQELLRQQQLQQEQQKLQQQEQFRLQKEEQLRQQQMEELRLQQEKENQLRLQQQQEFQLQQQQEQVRLQQQQQQQARLQEQQQSQLRLEQEKQEKLQLQQQLDMARNKFNQQIYWEQQQEQLRRQQEYQGQKRLQEEKRQQEQRRLEIERMRIEQRENDIKNSSDWYRGYNSTNVPNTKKDIPLKPKNNINHYSQYGQAQLSEALTAQPTIPAQQYAMIPPQGQVTSVVSAPQLYHPQQQQQQNTIVQYPQTLGAISTVQPIISPPTQTIPMIPQQVSQIPTTQTIPSITPHVSPVPTIQQIPATMPIQKEPLFAQTAPMVQQPVANTLVPQTTIPNNQTNIIPQQSPIVPQTMPVVSTPNIPQQTQNMINLTTNQSVPQMQQQINSTGEQQNVSVVTPKRKFRKSQFPGQYKDEADYIEEVKMRENKPNAYGGGDAGPAEIEDDLKYGYPIQMKANPRSRLLSIRAR